MCCLMGCQDLRILEFQYIALNVTDDLIFLIVNTRWQAIISNEAFNQLVDEASYIPTTVLNIIGANSQSIQL